MHPKAILRTAAALSVAAMVGAAALAPAPAQAQTANTRSYEITFSNLTTSQPISPPIFVTHTNHVDLFKVGKTASEGIRAIAEDGDNSKLAAAVTGMTGVADVVATSAPLHRIGGPGPIVQMAMIQSTDSAQWLSMVGMLICTNDAFAGLNGVHLPQNLNQTMVYRARSYDAGTESNDQLYANIVDPCNAIGPVSGTGDGMNGRVAEGGMVRPHHGIVANVGDLGKNAAAYNWRDPVVQVTVRRVK